MSAQPAGNELLLTEALDEAEGVARLVRCERAGAEDREHGVARHADVELPDVGLTDEIRGAAGDE